MFSEALLFFLLFFFGLAAHFAALCHTQLFGRAQKMEEGKSKNKIIGTRDANYKLMLKLSNKNLSLSSNSNSSILAHLSLGQMVSRIRRAPRAPRWEERDKTKVLDGTLFYV